ALKKDDPAVLLEICFLSEPRKIDGVEHGHLHQKRVQLRQAHLENVEEEPDAEPQKEKGGKHTKKESEQLNDQYGENEQSENDGEESAIRHYRGDFDSAEAEEIIDAIRGGTNVETLLLPDDAKVFALVGENPGFAVVHAKHLHARPLLRD